MGAVGPTVKLTFAGDATQLDKTMDGIGSSTDKMSSKVDDNSKKAGSSISGIKDKASEAGEESQKRFQGLADVVGGASDTFQGFKDGSVSEMAQGLAGMADGIVNFVIPTIAAMGTTLFSTVIPAVWGFTSALLANPITWIVVGIIALIAVIVLIATHFQQFKQIVSDVWGAIKSAFSAAWDFMSGIFDKIGHAVANVWNGFGDGLKAAINGVIWILNKGIDGINGLLHGINATLGWTGLHIGDVPHIPKLHQGGIVPGVAGSEMLTVLQAGERVIPATGPQQGGGGGTIRFAGNTDGVFATAFMNLVRSGQIELS